MAALLSLVVGASLVSGAAQAGSMRCDGKLIQPGDTKARLTVACGPPLVRDVVAVERALAEGEPIRLDYVETWTYPVPSSEGFQLLRFEAGRLVGEGMRCEGALVEAGHTTATVLQRCGEPLARDAEGLAPASAAPAPSTAPLEVPIEQWVYDRGKGRLLAIVTIRGGRVESIEDGERR